MLWKSYIAAGGHSMGCERAGLDPVQGSNTTLWHCQGDHDQAHHLWLRWHVMDVNARCLESLTGCRNVNFVCPFHSRHKIQSDFFSVWCLYKFLSQPQAFMHFFSFICMNEAKYFVSEKKNSCVLCRNISKHTALSGVLLN